MGCYNVESEMKLGEFKDQFAVGIIDKDKKKIKYLDDFVEIDKVKMICSTDEASATAERKRIIQT